jgi:hypothetical protein
VGTIVNGAEVTVDFNPFRGCADVDLQPIAATSWNAALTTLLGREGEDYNYGWSRRYDDADESWRVEQASCVALNADADVFVGGMVEGTLYEPIALVIKYNSDDTRAWVHTFGGGEYGNARVHGITTDSQGNVIVCGQFSGMVDFDPAEYGEDERTTAAGVADLFVTKFSDAGVYQWTQVSETAEYSGETAAKSVTTNADDDIFITGQFRSLTSYPPSPTDFDPESNLPPVGRYHEKFSAGGADAFVMTTASWITANASAVILPAMGWSSATTSSRSSIACWSAIPGFRTATARTWTATRR